jgi:hypothetical protein
MGGAVGNFPPAQSDYSFVGAALCPVTLAISGKVQPASANIVTAVQRTVNVTALLARWLQWGWPLSEIRCTRIQCGRSIAPPREKIRSRGAGQSDTFEIVMTADSRIKVQRDRYPSHVLQTTGR